MKLKRLALAMLLLASPLLASCNNGGGSSGSGVTPPTSSGDIPTGYVRVYFYADFNQQMSGEYLSTVDVEKGSKVSKPDNPTAPMPDFPVFLGWSYKELINDKNDLWDFSKDVIEPTDGSNVFNLYGIWAAEGEA